MPGRSRPRPWCPRRDPAQRFEQILDGLSRFAGRRLDVDEDVYRSESATGDRNRALAYLMHGAGSLAIDPIDAVETYSAVRGAGGHGRPGRHGGHARQRRRQSRDRRGRGARTGRGAGALGHGDVRHVRRGGEWLLRVGLPAKSGVSGGLVAASPARFGIAAYSPPLDATGSPVRAVAALRELSARFGLHLLHNPPRNAAPPAEVTTAADAPSSRPRQSAEWTLLERHGRHIVLVAAQGGLDFTAAERVLYALRDRVRPLLAGSSWTWSG